MTISDRRGQIKMAIARVPALDRTVRRLQRADAIAHLKLRWQSLEEQLTAVLAGKAQSGAQKSVISDRLGLLLYQCNICGRQNERAVTDLQREGSSCVRCGSSVRCRGVVHALSTALFNRSISIPDFPSRPDIVGCGLTDWEGYAGPLAQKLSYRNTFYHTEPFLDITNVPTSDAESLDFLISSDVFEHVRPPVRSAFENSRKLLKPTGVFILTVPYGLQPETIEHFPNLHNFQVVGDGDERRLVNDTSEGTSETFSNLVFHGGAGSTLEMRVFSKDNLLSDLREAGFSRVTICSDPCFEHGIFWWSPWSLPIIARP